MDGARGHDETDTRHPPGRRRFPQSAAAPASSAQFPLPGWPLFRLGFRPFYLGAAAFAAVGGAVLDRGPAGLGGTAFDDAALLWHAHEMLYGFAVAVIVGFLLTAGKAWTGPGHAARRHAGGDGRAVAGGAALSRGAPYAVYALLDMVLLPWVAWVLIRVLLKAGNRRNLPLAAILLLLTVANLCFHAAALGWLTSTRCVRCTPGWRWS
jgi:uncharacterized protein involved in response to NO